MKKHIFAFLALFLLAPLVHASQLELLSLSNTGSTNIGSITYSADGSSGNRHTDSSVYISQFHMTYTPTGGHAQPLLTYCVDVFHNEQWNTPYSVQEVVPLTNAFGRQNGLMMGYLYKKYGTTNYAGGSSSNPVTDAGLQLALWALSINQLDNPTAFTETSSGSGVYGDSFFSARNISSQVANQADYFLRSAFTAINGGSTLGSDVVLLFSGTDPGAQQSALFAPAPEPASVISWSICILTVGFGGLAARFRGRNLGLVGA